MDMAGAASSDITGIELRILRTKYRLTVSATAKAGGWSRQRVSAIEATDRPSRGAVDRYLAAIRAAIAAR